MNPVNFLEGLWNSVSHFTPDKLVTYDDFKDFYTRIYGWGDQVGLRRKARKMINKNIMYVLYMLLNIRIW